MQNLFVKEEDEFKIKFTVAVDEKGVVFCDMNKESLIESFGDRVSNLEIKDYNATFKKPSFGDSVELHESIFSLTNGVDVNFNPIMVRYNKISALIKSWDLKGQDEKPSENDIKKLHPTIATVIGICVDAEVGGIFG
jgi:hypothetical protein